MPDLVRVRRGWDLYREHRVPLIDVPTTPSDVCASIARLVLDHERDRRVREHMYELIADAVAIASWHMMSHSGEPRRSTRTTEAALDEW